MWGWCVACGVALHRVGLAPAVCQNGPHLGKPERKTTDGRTLKLV